MTDKLLHTPAGLRDIYSLECAKKHMMEERLHHIMHLYGYQDIETPTFEYYEVFDQDTGTVAPKETYRFFDRENNLVVLRPDITPSIARAASKYYSYSDLPVRLCYKGNTFRNKESYQGKMNEVTQLGAELIGDSSTDADAEIIAILVRTMLQAGLTEFQIDLGQIDYFNGLIEEAALDKVLEEEVKSLIEEKNFFGVETLLSDKQMPENAKIALIRLQELFGSLDKLETAKSLTSNPKSIQAVARLEEVYKILSIYGYEKYITFDLSMIHKLDYYTGVIFSVHTYGLGAHIAMGGRYDKLMSQYGKDAPAIGFAISMDELLTALDRQKINIATENTNTMILYHQQLRKEAISIAESFRADGLQIELQNMSKNRTIETYMISAQKRGIGGIIFIENEDNIQVIEIATGNITETTLKDLMGGAQ
jgi:ATP phosphoribosyltransferase regulatory subunit